MNEQLNTHERRALYWKALSAIKEKEMSPDQTEQLKDLALEIYNVEGYNEDGHHKAKELCHHIIQTVKIL